MDFSKAEGRWSRLGSYYAMFPVAFASEVITARTQEGQTVIDPFCGRGTAPFVAMTTGRRAVGCDINPIAWLYAQCKIDPHPVLPEVEARLAQVSQGAWGGDDEPSNEFQQMAFCRRVLGFIRAARKMLDWRNNRLDRTLMAFIVHHLHDKLGRGLSNQMRHSRSMSPGYCIRWWRRRGLSAPPEIDPHAFLLGRVRRRYAKGTPGPLEGLDRPRIGLGDAAHALPTIPPPYADLVLTSPPYSGVTNYRSDNWLRLWAIGEAPALPDWNPEQKFLDLETYTNMLRAVFIATRQRAKPGAIWYIRSDARQKTKDAIMRVLSELLPEHGLTEYPAPYRHRTQTALYGDSHQKPGEVDLIMSRAATGHG
ncbi:hypothetical protein NKDENANG_01957 [Candidatus Entotheonellaceae bacterium PAL068K]